MANAAVVRWLDAFGAGKIAHPGGDLLSHLVRVSRGLERWGAEDELVAAGLCRAAYGTDGFAPKLIEISQRDELIALIGEAAETIVYDYASCDRAHLYSQLGSVKAPTFRDRFTGVVFKLPAGGLQQFMELTFANELDLVQASPVFAAEHGAALAELFGRAVHLVSDAARAAMKQLLPTSGTRPT